MNVQEASIFWGVSKSHVRRLCATGRVSSARKIKGKWIMNPLAAKPFDRRFKKPTLTVFETIWTKDKIISTNTRRLCDCPTFTVINGLIVILNIHERLAYIRKWNILAFSAFLRETENIPTSLHYVSVGLKNNDYILKAM